MADHQGAATDHLFVKILNLLAFLLFFSSGLYSSLGPHGFYGHKETYITPAAYSFWAWTVIDFLLLGLVVYQFFPGGTETVVHVISWRFIWVGVLNSIFIHLYVKEYYIVAFIFALLTALSISHIYYDLKTKNIPTTWADLVFIQLPFSLWHAFSVVVAVISLFSAFGRTKHGKPGVGTEAAVIIALAWLAATSIGYALHSELGDVAGATVIAWELFAIFLNQRDPAIHWVALAAFIISVLSIAKTVYYGYTTRKTGSISLPGGDERAPLVG